MLNSSDWSAHAGEAVRAELATDPIDCVAKCSPDVVVTVSSTVRSACTASQAPGLALLIDAGVDA